MKPLLIIPAYISKDRHRELLEQTIDSIFQTVDEADVLVVDDGSAAYANNKYAAKTYYDLKGLYPGIDLHFKPENTGFSATVNVGLQRALENEVDAVLINADVVFADNNWLRELQATEGDIVGGKLLYPNNTIQHAGVYFSAFTKSFDHRFRGSPRNLVSANEICKCPITAALQFIDWEVLDKIGLYDEDFKMGHEDVDFCIRATQAGFSCVYNPEVEAIHFENAFRGDASEKVKRWEKESVITLLRKYPDTSFIDIAPTMLKEFDEAR
jgi:GT2 family glycosyltransferase